MTARSRSRAVAGHARRTKPVRRASARLSPVRAGAALAMLAAAAGIYGVASSPAFAVTTLELEGLRYTDEALVRDRLAVPEDTNLFRVQTDPLEAALLELPTVRAATVTIELPGTLAVEVEEREPLLVWAIEPTRFLVDREGTLFAAAGDRPAAGTGTLPVVLDHRAGSRSLGVGDRLDPVDLDAATRLGSLRPADVGSAADALEIALTDDQGYVVRPVPPGWSAVFGFYGPSLRTPEMVPGQVRLLRSLLLEQGETGVVTVVLASETDGTFTTPRPARKP